MQPRFEVGEGVYIYSAEGNIYYAIIKEIRIVNNKVFYKFEAFILYDDPWLPEEHLFRRETDLLDTDFIKKFHDIHPRVYSF